MTTKTPDPVDVAVGRRIQIERMSRGISQTELGKCIGVSFQQVQKYEKGINRVGPSRLSGIAEAFGIPIAALFEHVNTSETAPFNDNRALYWLTIGGALRLLRAYSEIPEGPLRRIIVELTEEVAKNQKVKRK